MAVYPQTAKVSQPAAGSLNDPVDRLRLGIKQAQLVSLEYGKAKSMEYHEIFKEYERSIVKNISILGNCLGTKEDLKQAIDLQEKAKLKPILDRQYSLNQGADFVQRSFFDFNRLGKLLYTSHEKEIVMEVDRLMELGELYRELRIARGLKIKDIACNNLSKSQLSRFENGQTMLAADKLLLAISGIHMSFSEFGYALSHYEESDFFKRGHKLSELYVHQDIEGLKKLLETNDNYEVFDVYNHLNKLVIEVAIHSLDTDYIISDDDKNFLTTYLYNIEEWTEYELYIFGNTMSILSSDDLIFLGKAFVERDKLYRSLPSHKKSAELVFLNLILLLIERKNFYQAIYFSENLEKLLNYQDMFATTFLKFFKKVILYLQEKSVNMSELEYYINIVEEINPTIATILKSNLNQLLPSLDH